MHEYKEIRTEYKDMLWCKYIYISCIPSTEKSKTDFKGKNWKIENISFTQPQAVPNFYEFLLLSTKEDMKNSYFIVVHLMVAIDFHIFFPYYESQWLPSTVWLTTFFKIYFFVHQKTKTHRFSDNLMVIKLLHMFIFVWAIHMHCLLGCDLKRSFVWTFQNNNYTF